MPERDIGKGLIIGRVALIDKSDKYVLGSNVLSLTVNIDNSSQFLFQIINESNFRKKVKKIVNGSAQLMITSKDVKKLELKLPIIEEQRKITNFLSSIDNKIEQVGKQLEESKQFKKALLQQMFV
jgi:type I restriction enzyme S subunit